MYGKNSFEANLQKILQYSLGTLLLSKYIIICVLFYFL